MDGGVFANGRMDMPLSDNEQKIRLFPMHSTKRPVSVTSNETETSAKYYKYPIDDTTFFAYNEHINAMMERVDCKQTS